MNGPSDSALKTYTSLIIVVAIVTVWLYQIVVTGAVDFSIQALGMLFAAAAGITLFGRGTLKSAQSLMDKMPNRNQSNG